MNNRYQQTFNRNSSNKGVLVPFLMLGDFSLQDTLQWVDMLVNHGADALELGMPFSDPVADGPVIQKAAIKALENGITPKDCFEIIHHIRKRYPNLPLGLLTYANLVVASGLREFYQRAKSAGLDSVLLADIPVHAIDVFKKYANAASIDQILIATPNANEKQLEQIAHKTSGYTYVVSRSGVTGENNQSGVPATILKQLKKFNAPPALLGFGISSTEHVKNAIAAGFDGVICGSALVSVQHQYQKKERLQKGTQLMQNLVSGLSG